MTNQHTSFHEAPCSRCGGEAQWRFLDAEQRTVEVECADCGRFEASRSDFERAESEIVETSDF